MLLIVPLAAAAAAAFQCRTPGSTRWAGPSLGHHTELILKGELGMSDAQIQDLRSKGAI